MLDGSPYFPGWRTLRWPLCWMPAHISHVRHAKVAWQGKAQGNALHAKAVWHHKEGHKEPGVIIMLDASLCFSGGLCDGHYAKCQPRDLSTIHGLPNGYQSFARSNVTRCIFNKLNASPYGVCDGLARTFTNPAAAASGYARSVASMQPCTPIKVSAADQRVPWASWPGRDPPLAWMMKRPRLSLQHREQRRCFVERTNGAASGQGCLCSTARTGGVCGGGAAPGHESLPFLAGSPAAGAEYGVVPVKLLAQLCPVGAPDSEPQFEVIRAVMLVDSPCVLHEQSTHRSSTSAPLLQQGVEKVD